LLDVKLAALTGASSADFAWAKWQKENLALRQSCDLDSAQRKRLSLPEKLRPTKHMEKTPRRQPKVSIIVLSWNSYDVTRDCLLSLRKIDYPAFEVVLVDNGSVDGSGKKLAQDFPEVKVILNDKNLGFTGGNNVGMRDVLARGTDYLLLLNNDTIVAPNFLTELVHVAESDERISMVNPKIYYFEPADKIWYAGGEYVPWKTFPVHFGLRESDVGSYDQTKEVSFVSGCALLVKAEVVQKVGLLDEIFFMGYEDVDWSVRAVRAGYKAMYAPASVVWHRDSYVTKQSMGFARRDFYNMRNAVLCARKYLPLHQLPLFAFSMSKYVGYVTLRSLFQADFKRAAGLYRGLWSGCWTTIPEKLPPL
jgi:GT2 family glycosyltransferase